MTQSNASDPSKSARRRPVHSIKYGTVRAAIWSNIVDNGNASRAVYTVTFSRNYRDAQNQWNETQSFKADDLLLLAKAADEAHSWIIKVGMAERGPARSGTADANKT